jgi:predicted aspartyl protease
MMQGVVNLSCEATLSLVVSNTNRQNQLIDAVIDTGYTGFLSLPREIIVTLNLPWTGIDYLGWAVSKHSGERSRD